MAARTAHRAPRFAVAAPRPGATRRQKTRMAGWQCVAASVAMSSTARTGLAQPRSRADGARQLFRLRAGAAAHMGGPGCLACRAPHISGVPRRRRRPCPPEKPEHARQAVIEPGEVLTARLDGSLRRHEHPTRLRHAPQPRMKALAVVRIDEPRRIGTANSPPGRRYRTPQGSVGQSGLVLTSFRPAGAGDSSKLGRCRGRAALGNLLIKSLPLLIKSLPPFP